MRFTQLCRRNKACSFVISSMKEPVNQYPDINKSWWGHKFIIQKYQIKDKNLQEQRTKGWWQNKTEIKRVMENQKNK